MKLSAKELRRERPNDRDREKIKRNSIYIVLDNVIDTYNVGAIFRLADAVAAEKVFLCGDTLTPDNKKEGHRIHKSSVGTWRWIPWQYEKTALTAITKLTAHYPQITTVCVEQHDKSIPYSQITAPFPIAIIVGNETYGITKEVLDAADQIVEIPMWGVNKSLNVMVSLAVVLYKVMQQQ